MAIEIRGKIKQRLNTFGSLGMAGARKMLEISLIDNHRCSFHTDNAIIWHTEVQKPQTKLAELDEIT
ncbi:MAG TPA: hypothetical protein VFV82_00770 [Candidatus Binatia bacterium]|nr:hypothetical protein [Candidatus Binatia bacterium]